ncbi:hypothetical protein HER10_EVM0006467 [Colletotrichum scovillei]|uniref:Uncharacterized protein n=1 Tax=Colletotrichum scovillei TaxID=1209932 RepID=A0A9P7RE16_9PEZI|nr:uncharacterized protein HER10_EVM0006467 [Colletotrichum scovillei]KAF4773915.1 hypothetical protein HER10_EVM0006467 [Colletotrichum scovillei]KAG7055907.1 hypothetical protein JMJ77_0008358 [Colletotrichum scovillei]KAG7075279.1 hypothetical protein JMJ76_0011740 [Colletotrichum scovillei]KAG7082495.1 hypothetical protein JMJ78_0004596 [Colletotrichum scovillei]
MGTSGFVFKHVFSLLFNILFHLYQAFYMYMPWNESMSKENGTAFSNSFSDIEIAKAVFDTAYGTVLRQEGKDIQWLDLCRYASTRDVIEIRLQEAGWEDAGDKLQLAFDRFHNEMEPLNETQATWAKIVEATNFTYVTSKFRPFLDASLDTEEEQDYARKALCKIFGVRGTLKVKQETQNMYESRRIVIQNAEAAWLNTDRKTLIEFVSRLAVLVDHEDEDARWADLHKMAGTDENLREALDDHRHAVKDEL